MSTAAFVRPEFRTLGSLPLAALATLALIYGMHHLIKQEIHYLQTLMETEKLELLTKKSSEIQIQFTHTLLQITFLTKTLT